MTALDDALASSSVTFGPHQIKAYWRESDNADIDTNVDAVGNLTDQFGGAMTVSHSLNDALPDPVTMSTSDDAGGTLTAGLNGREGLTLATSGSHSTGATGQASGTAAMSITATLPAGAVKGDFLISVILINDNTATLTQTILDPKDQWQLAGVIADAPVAAYVYYKRRWNANNIPLEVMSDKAVTYLAVTNAFWAKNPTGIALDYRVTDTQLKAETASITAHTVNSTLKDKGYQFVFFGSALGGVPTGGTGVATLGSLSASGYVLYTGFSSSLQESGNRSLTINQSPANATAVLGAISIEPYARPRLDARQYFSPFNSDSPVFGFDRDTAQVLAAIRTLTSSGIVDSQIFSGQMQGVPLTGRQATMNAVSKTRIRMNRSLALPIVSGYREGLTLDWLVTWLASRGSQFAGPAPNRYTRYWVPAHGSIHPHLHGDRPYSAALLWDPTRSPSGPYGYKNVDAVPGPFVSGMYAEQTATMTKKVRFYTVSGFNNEPDDAFPHIVEAGGPFKFDMFSQQNSKGRICFYIRADPVTTPLAYSAEDFIALISVNVRDSSGNQIGTVICGIDSDPRRAYVQMGSVTPGNATIEYSPSGLLPSDGTWHFFGFWWDFAGGTARVIHNTGISSSDYWLTNGFNFVDDLPFFDGESGSTVSVDAHFHLPVSEFMYDAGWPDPGIVTSNWNDQYPNPTGRNMTMRPTNQNLRALAQSTAVNGWEMLAEAAKASLSAYRVNESDNLEFLPQPYFGETEQATPVAVQDTRSNAEDLDVEIDPSKIRNRVTVQFQDTRIDGQPQPVVAYNSSTEIPPGISTWTFPLDVPCVEIHGDGVPGNANYEILNLTSTQIGTGVLPSLRHFISFNTSIDGNGTVLDASAVTVAIAGSDALSIDLTFNNRTGKSVFIANNGEQVPFLLILGYGVRISDGYSTTSDPYSLQLRGDRSLDAELPLIQDRPTAEQISSTLTTQLARPRPRLTVVTKGNPLRKPGQLVTMADAEGTAAAGNWRVMAVDHNVNGAEYTNSLSLVQVLPAAVWDGPNGWDAAVWS